MAQHMFRCEFCQSMIGPGVRSGLVTVETRQVTYPVRERAKRRPRRQRCDDLKKSKWISDPGGTGREIVKESRACPTCCNAYSLAENTNNSEFNASPTVYAQRVNLIDFDSA